MKNNNPQNRIHAPDPSDPYHKYHGKTGKVCMPWYFPDDGSDPIPFTVGLGMRVDENAITPIPG
jgi:hypothetical protein